MDTDVRKIKILEVAEAARIIIQGGIVTFPTETVYGLGADAFKPEAVLRIFEVKHRPKTHPLIVHIAHLNDLGKVTSRISGTAEKLIAAFWPGALTLILPKSETLSQIVTGGLSSVGIRMPSHPVAIALIQECGTPIAAPSANQYGKVSPTCLSHVLEWADGNIDGIVQGGRSSVGVESTIVSLLSEIPTVLRMGGISIEMIEKEIGRVEVACHSNIPIAPGMHTKHYCPTTPFRVVTMEKELSSINGKGRGLLCLQEPLEENSFDAVEILSRSGDLAEAAFNLYSSLRNLDEKKFLEIIAIKVPEYGLGKTINDRLMRAQS